MDPIEFLFGLEPLGMKFGLENMRVLCEALRHPERAFRSVIIAGTNGKGSVAAIVSAAIHAAGLRVARYTSPHLLRLEERFVVNEREVDTGRLRAAAADVQEVVERLRRDGTLSALPTFFEATTATAFVLFRQAAIDLAVLEVGLGGRLDATNVAEPMAAAITSIGLDHQALLGSTLAGIAREKAGVIKPGIPVVAGRLPGEADAVIEDVCRAQGCRLVRVGREVRVTAAIDSQGRTRASIVTPRRRLEDVPLALNGRHQAGNAAVAVALLDELNALGVSISDEAAVAGLTRARWPARLERFDYRGCDVLLDAAHNPDGAGALAAYLREIGWTGVTLVFGAMRDKDVRGMLDALLPLCARVICVTAPGARALGAAEIAALVRDAAPAAAIEAVDAPADALARACAASERRVVAAGSIFLIGPLRGILR